MAISTVYSAKFTAFILIILCTETHIFASEDDIYHIEANQDVSKFQEISVIKYERSRQKRQTGGSSNMTTAGTPTTTPNLLDYNIQHDDHSYYESLMFKPLDLNEFWVELKDVTGHSTLSDSHRTAVTAKLPFRFPFYGHLIDNVTIATGGFLYMSPFLHQWLTATQYIAPLMANFDTRVGNTSEVFYSSMDKKFVVEWRDVHLQDQNGRSDEGTGSFQFQAILHMNGSIAFVYKQLPIPIVNISSSAHPVKIGLSDAFYFDTTAFGMKKSCLLFLALLKPQFGLNGIIFLCKLLEPQFGIFVPFVALLEPQHLAVCMILVLFFFISACNRFSDCESCVSAKIDFKCRWCGIINRCSDSVDWHRQKWLNAGCVHLSVADNETCSQVLNTTTTTISTTNSTSGNLSTTTATYSTTTGSKTQPKTETTKSIPNIITIYPCPKGSGVGNCSAIPTAKPPTTEKQSSEKPYMKGQDSSSVGKQVGVIVVVVVIVLVLVGAIGGWVYYAYTHPTSASGMWLMEHRPSQMKAKMSNMKFWKRNGTAGDKYAVESTA
ncbi:plexin domain-containing protein 2-like [Mercenaria mercenaria]|uniref:plexin domain-containing protein 2-like n=1 Tax=Mercenaria mercenaria TaxID=6596 RepID=UPI00234EA82F|nr:plexin domain-containing protein 2-like [Mercenaria mercenaria]